MSNAVLITLIICGFVVGIVLLFVSVFVFLGHKISKDIKDELK